MKTFNEMLYLHWKAARWPLAPVTLLAFSLPMLVTRMIRVPREFGYGTGSIPGDIIQLESGWLPLFPFLAILVGAMIALTAWSWDHQGRHVYALSLPITRGRYALAKMAAGLLLLAMPVVALAAGTLLGLALTQLPPELHGYPFSFVARFALAAVIIYAATFALASSTVRVTVFIILGLVTLIVGGSILVLFLQDALHNHNITTPAEMLYDALMNWPGPFSVFGGSWLFIDA